MDLKQARKEHAQGKCELCGFTGKHLHHIFPGRKNRKISECFETVRFLCEKCHSYIHGNGFELLNKLQIEACNDLIQKFGEDETRRLLGGLYFEKKPKTRGKNERSY